MLTGHSDHILSRPHRSSIPRNIRKRKELCLWQKKFITDYPPDSPIDYNWTEFHDKELRRILADTIITINQKYSYHIEAQLLKDDNLVFRVFEYGFYHANRNHASTSTADILPFPEPRIIYLYATQDIPDEYSLMLDFGRQGTFSYKIPVIKYLHTSPDELTRKKMIILIPFELLKLRDAMKKERSPENLEQLKNLIQNDIIWLVQKKNKRHKVTFVFLALANEQTGCEADEKMRSMGLRVG